MSTRLLILFEAGRYAAVPDTWVLFLIERVFKSTGFLRPGNYKYKEIFSSLRVTIVSKNKLISSMSKSSTLAIGIGLASGALLAAWLLTGTRKEKTRKFISEKTASIRKTIKTEKPVYDEAESYLS
jgi:hypothetical protein